MFTLADAEPGETVEVEEIICCGEYDMRIMEMGILPGTEIHICSRGPMGDPIKIKLLNYTAALRLKDADKIIVKRLL